MSHIKIVEVETPEQIPLARQLFLEYAKSLDFDLCFQNFDEELASLPGKYSPPSGRLFLGYFQGDLAGCVGLRDLGGTVCEMKRLFVRPEFRGKQIGYGLASALIHAATEIGYSRMRLDTVSPLMSSAIKMYREMGFQEIPPYTKNPIAGALYMELVLREVRWNQSSNVVDRRGSN